MSHDSSLEPVLRAVEPSARLIPERHLRQVLHYLIDRGHPLPTNTALPFWVSRDDLAAADVLPDHVTAGTDPALLLITDPDDRMIRDLPRAEQLRVYWRVLFRAAVLRDLGRKLAAGAVTPETCRERLNQFGAAAAREIRTVLDAEHLVARGADDDVVYRAFAATYLDLVAFDPHRAESYFPSLPHGPAVGQLLGADVPWAELQRRTRPAGAADPEHDPPPDERWTAPDSVVVTPPPRVNDRGGVRGGPGDAERKGNNVRAAILRTQVAAAGGPAHELARAGALTALGRLVDSLGDVFAWDHATRQEWRQALAPVLEPAAAGAWPRAARCLYELQKIPADLSREVYAVDLAEAIRTFGRRPVKRPLPRAKRVVILMALRRAHGQLLRTGLGHAVHLRLDRLFHHQTHRLEHEVRGELTPVIRESLTRAGLVPENAVEDVGRDKLVAELLDRVCDRGYLRIGDLRDSVARNRLKMPDLRGPVEWVRGDPLLRADKNLAEALDGVYRKGEFYLRGLQRLSSLFFANPAGRALFLYLLLPFAGALMTVVFAQEMAHLARDGYRFVEKYVTRKPVAPAATPAAAPAPAPKPDDDLVTADEVTTDEEGGFVWYESPDAATLFRDLFTVPGGAAKSGEGGHFHVPWGWVGGLSAFLFLTLHVPPFRRGVAAAASHLWRVVRGLVWDWPRAVWHSPAVRGFRQSRPVRLFTRHFWTPLLLSALLFGVMLLTRFTPRFLYAWGWAIWAVLTVAYNTPWGWVIQDRIAEAVSDWWRTIRVNLIPGLIATILDWFRAMANWVERQLYAVDERLRFRGGDSGGSLAAKAVLGVVWLPIAYVTRFAFNLLLEPQINPVKHFPVVTVSHKLLLPLVPAFGELIAAQTGWGEVKANGWAFGIIACIPGVFGFIAWELLSNWQLYRANRGARLGPVTLGSHGESMRGLLRPGFHSGTVPKLFRKLRHADGARASRLHHDLDHTAEAVHRFAERELAHLLERSPEWGGVSVHVAAVHLGCQRVTAELAAPALGRDPFVLAFENVGGRIEAAVGPVGWVGKLTAGQTAAFAAALRGLLDMAAVERVDGRERSDDAAGGAGLADLARPVSWAEWVARWGPKAA